MFYNIQKCFTSPAQDQRRLLVAGLVRGFYNYAPKEINILTQPKSSVVCEAQGWEQEE